MACLYKNAAKKLSDEARWRTAVRASPDNFFALARSACGQTEQGLVLTDRPHGEAIIAVAVAHAAVARIEAEAPRVVRVACAEGPRPVVAVGAGVAELTAPAVASGRKEEDHPVFPSKKPSLHAIPSLPYVVGIFEQFFPLLLCGHAPSTAPVHRSSIILWL